MKVSKLIKMLENHSINHSNLSFGEVTSKIKNSLMYISCSPCSICTKMIINANIIEIRFREIYTDRLGLEIFKNCDYKPYKQQDFYIMRKDND